MIKENMREETQQESDKKRGGGLPIFPQKLITDLAEEVAKIVAARLPHGLRTRKKKKQSSKKIENAVFLDTSAIIDGRVFEVVNLGVLSGVFVIIDSILLELKYIADSQDAVKRERGRTGLELLEKLRKTRGVKSIILSEYADLNKNTEVDEMLIRLAKVKKGKIVTCDYNLAKKAAIERVKVVNINELAHRLKIRAVPGESLHVKVLHLGRDATQGVGYLDDGTMIVVEYGRDDIGKTIDVVVSRVLQTAAGRILFSKKI